MLLLLPRDKTRGAVDLIARQPLYNSSSMLNTDLDFNKVFVAPLTFEDCYIKHNDTAPCIIDRGGYNSTHKLFTAHYKRAVLCPPFYEPVTTQAPPFVPQLSIPIRMLIKPKIQPFKVTMNLMGVSERIQSCTEEYTHCLPLLQFSSKGRQYGCSPLQLVAILVFLAGSAIGVSIAGAMTEELCVQISSLKQASDTQTQAIHAISSSLHVTMVLTHKLYEEPLLFEKQINSSWTSQQELNKQILKMLKVLKSDNKCLHLERLRD